MMGPTPKRAARWLVGASVMLLLLALARPEEARAGCDHLGPVVGHFENLASAGVLPEAQAPRPDRSGGPKPCTGPWCSKAPAAPSGPMRVASLGIEPWACLTPGVLVLPPAPTPYPRDDDEVALDPEGMSVFHPPRSASSR